jgi:hypothetical protein
MEAPAFRALRRPHFESAIFPFVAGGFTVPGYAALYALTINFGVSVIL